MTTHAFIFQNRNSGRADQVSFCSVVKIICLGHRGFNFWNEAEITFDWFLFCEGKKRGADLASDTIHNDSAKRTLGGFHSQCCENRWTDVDDKNLQKKHIKSNLQQLQRIRVKVKSKPQTWCGLNVMLFNKKLGWITGNLSNLKLIRQIKLADGVGGIHREPDRAWTGSFNPFRNLLLSRIFPCLTLQIASKWTHRNRKWYLEKSLKSSRDRFTPDKNHI